MDVHKIFNHVVKNEEDRKASKRGINFERFSEVLFLIATKGKKLLNKLSRKRVKME